MSKKSGLRITAKVEIKKGDYRGLSSEALRRTVEAGGRVIQAAAQVNANEVFSDKATNTLANSIIVESEAKGNKAEARIGPTVIYGRAQELGAVILPVHKKMLSWVNDLGERVFANVVHLKPKPYMRPAVDNNKGKIEDAMRAQLEKELKR